MRHPEPPRERINLLGALVWGAMIGGALVWGAMIGLLVFGWSYALIRAGLALF